MTSLHRGLHSLDFIPATCACSAEWVCLQTQVERNLDLDVITPVPRSVRLNGRSTCIRLERVYWRMLEVIAQRQAVTVNSLLAQLDLEVQQNGLNVRNFTALIRVMTVVTLLRNAGVVL